MTAPEPPVRGDHHSTWTAVALIVLMFVFAVALAAALAGQAFG